MLVLKAWGRCPTFKKDQGMVTSKKHTHIIYREKERENKK
jgi:hypothetical protein